MENPRYGDTVLVDFVGRLKNGAVFTTSKKEAPLRFTIGKGEVIPGFEQAVLGMKPGETRTAEIDAKQAFGHHRGELVWEVPREKLPDDKQPREGERLQIRRPQREPFLATVRQVKPEGVVLDANHPLAGEDVVFDIRLVAVD